MKRIIVTNKYFFCEMCGRCRSVLKIRGECARLNFPVGGK